MKIVAFQDVALFQVLLSTVAYVSLGLVLVLWRRVTKLRRKLDAATSQRAGTRPAAPATVAEDAADDLQSPADGAGDTGRLGIRGILETRLAARRSAAPTPHFAGASFFGGRGHGQDRAAVVPSGGPSEPHDWWIAGVV